MRIFGTCLALWATDVVAETGEDWIRVEVTATPPPYASAVAKILPSGAALDETNTSTVDLATLLDDSAAITLNGQGGLFQTVNIRGFARWRIKTLVEGVPIHTERRAGNTAEFVSPSMVQQAYVIPGAASAQFGSGAIGGGVDVFLRAPQQHHLHLSYIPTNDYREVLFAGVNNDREFSWMLNHRHSNNSKDGAKAAIHDQFEKHSLVLRKHSDNGWLREALVLLSEANNVAKASSDDPGQRLTIYPTNSHQWGKAVFAWRNATVYAHRSNLLTDITRPGQRVNQLTSEALNSGFNISDKHLFEKLALHWRVGVDSRFGVRVNEQQFGLIDGTISAQQNIDGQQWELYAAADITRDVNNGFWALGARMAHMEQEKSLN
ncbi:TonB-dependent receptor plug domain-containing protein [Alteromonas arenosi]|nr:TonB-dependent receptor plug domain-containing protein [Alteromonas sp. ASW11-36]